MRRTPGREGYSLGHHLHIFLCYQYDKENKTLTKMYDWTPTEKYSDVFPLPIQDCAGNDLRWNRLNEGLILKMNHLQKQHCNTWCNNIFKKKKKKSLLISLKYHILSCCKLQLQLVLFHIECLLWNDKVTWQLFFFLFFWNFKNIELSNTFYSISLPQRKKPHNIH